MSHRYSDPWEEIRIRRNTTQNSAPKHLRKQRNPDDLDSDSPRNETRDGRSWYLFITVVVALLMFVGWAWYKDPLF